MASEISYRRKRMLEATALQRLEELVEDWELHHAEKVNAGQYVVWGSGDYELDLRDMLVVMAAAKGEIDGALGHLRYLELSEQAVKGWRASNIRQQSSLNTMLNARASALDIINNSDTMSDVDKSALRRALS